MARIALMGTEYRHNRAQYIDFTSNESSLDYDVLLWDPTGFVYSPTSGVTMDGYEALDQRNSSLFMALLNRREVELRDMLKLGRTVIIHNSYPQNYSLYSGYFGNVLNIVPGLRLELTQAFGKNLEFRGEEPFASLWKSNKESFRYKSYFNGFSGKPLFVIKGTPFVVGYYANTDSGNLIFIPALVSGSAIESGYIEMIDNFIDSIEELVRNLRKGADIFALPPWSLNHNLLHENEMRKNLSSLEEELNTIRQKIAKEQELIAELEKGKILFLGSGRMLEIQVKKVLEELGFLTTEGLPGRDDLILKYGDRVAVVEVKGTTKSAAEGHAAQLEKWVSDYLISKGIKPKGILIVNSYKDIPLTDRKEPTFPDQMLEYSEKRGHCLITGLQLLGMYLDCKDNPEKKPEMIERMFATVGVFSEYQDWTGFISSRIEVTK